MRYELTIEILIDGTKEYAIEKGNMLCETINDSDKKNKAWLSKVIVDTAEVAKDTSAKEIDSF